MIAIIGAMEVEIEGLKQLLTDKVVTKIGSLEFFSGKIYNKEVVIVRCGIGKVNAAAATATLLTKFDVSEVINTGIAGGVGQLTKPLDIVVASSVVQHDYDATAAGYALGQTEPNHCGQYPCCERLVEAFFAIATDKARSHRGLIATGDKFVACDRDVEALRENFGAIACDMESGAIERVARLFGKDFIAIRAISDNADNDAIMSFSEFEQAAARTSIEVMGEYIKKCN